ncbi:MFS general substrate transporter [Exidia glandulosa HHB12029]|uniref:MFS general substrate transporter n=1 Tax=Exidia glandulosa HHB12029 TaxID=1314781 RepID=A0A166A4P1_EXIGL|nr:MFS general substrate transporter [Exidia glandulosa HHB12029]
MADIEKKPLEDVEHSSHEEYADASKQQVPPPPVEFSEAEVKKLYRKIDFRLMPILSLMYLLSFMDRGNAKIQGLVDQLHLTGNRYNIALKFRPSRWLPGITVLWGIVMTLMGLVTTYPQLVGVRVCLGIAEAGLFPGVVYYLTLWYPRNKTAYRIGLFFGAATLAGAFSGLLAYGISFMSGVRGRLGWSWIFILEGIATVLVGVLAFILLHGADFPGAAKFLTDNEKAYIMWRKSSSALASQYLYDNSVVGEAEHFKMRYVWSALGDWQLYLHILVYMSIICPLYGISLFLPFGYTTAVTQLLTVPPYVFATIVLLFFAHFSDKHHLRWPFIVAGQLMCLVGFAINISDTSRGAKYFGTFLCVGGSYSAFPILIAWLGNNVAGQYKRGVEMAAHIGIGNFSGAIASNIFRSQDAPRYAVGHGVEMGFVVMGLITVPILVFIYKGINAKRDREELAHDGKARYNADELRELGDRAPDFRYTI